MFSFDALDARLIALLANDARTGVVQLADRLSVARNTVQARLKRLVEEKVVRGFMPLIDLPAVGVAVEGFAAIALEQAHLDVVVQELATLPQVLEVHATTGREDLLVRLAAQTHADLQDVIQRVVSIPGVAHSDTRIVLSTPLRYRVQPLLNAVTELAGFGRSTPAPAETGSARLPAD